MKKICVLGSINIDLVAKTTRFPLPGESIEGSSFNIFPGGKGANQAVAAGRLGADVTLLGKVGNDVFSETALSALKAANVDTSRVLRAETSTGVAVITVNDNGENYLVYIPGANALVDAEYVKSNADIIDSSDILMMQLETPIETVEWAAEYALSKNKTVILDPAPAGNLSERLLGNCSIITPNETEFELISGTAIRDENDMKAAGEALTNGGAKIIINKCGSRGAYLLMKDKAVLIPGYKVKAVDSTAAGDSFNAGLAVSLALGRELEESIAFANAVGAISVTKMGAQSSMPGLDEVTDFIKNNSR